MTGSRSLWRLSHSGWHHIGLRQRRAYVEGDITYKVAVSMWWVSYIVLWIYIVRFILFFTDALRWGCCCCAFAYLLEGNLWLFCWWRTGCWRNVTLVGVYQNGNTSHYASFHWGKENIHEHKWSWQVFHNWLLICVLRQIWRKGRGRGRERWG